MKVERSKLMYVLQDVGKHLKETPQINLFRPLRRVFTVLNLHLTLYSFLLYLAVHL